MPQAVADSSPSPMLGGVSTGARSSRGWILLGALFLFALTTLAYLPAINGSSGFVWDDNSHLTANPSVRTNEGLLQTWTWAPYALLHPDAHIVPATPQYYPLTFSSFWLDYHFWQYRPLGYHVVNLVLHLLSAVLFWRILVRLGFSLPVSFFAAAVFAVHPMNVESVAWVTERKNTLSLPFALAATLCWLRWTGIASTNAQAPKRDITPVDGWSFVWLFAATVLFTLSLLAKSSTVVLPPLLLILAWYKRGNLSWRDVVGAVPLFAVAIVAGVVTTIVEHRFIGAEGPTFHLNWDARFLLVGRAFVFYLQDFFLPIRQIFIYPHWTIASGNWVQWIFPIAAIAGLLLFFAMQRYFGRGPVAALLMAGVALAPTLGIVSFFFQKFSYVADHFAYIASLSLATLLAGGLSWLSGQGHFPKVVNWVVAGIVLTTFSFLTFRQTYDYKDEPTVYRKTLAKNPHAWMCAENLANLLCQSDGAAAYPEACLLYQSVLDENPADTKASCSFSTVLIGMHDYPRAQTVLERAIALDPKDPAAHNNLGNAFLLQKKYDDALPHYDLSAALNPDNAENFFNWGNALLSAGRPDTAEEKFTQAISLLKKPDPKYTFYLGLSQRDQQKLTAAIHSFDKTIDIDSTNTDAFYELGNIYARIHQDRKAIECFQAALHTNRDHYATLVALAQLVMITDLPDKRDPLLAADLLQHALDLQHGKNVALAIEHADAVAAAKFYDEAIDALDLILKTAPMPAASATTNAAGSPDAPVDPGVLTPELRELVMARIQELRHKQNAATSPSSMP